MFIQTAPITADEARALGPGMELAPDDTEAMAQAVAQSAPALVFSVTRPFVVCGFIPLDLCCTAAYAWMQWSPEIYQRPIGTTRKWVEVMTEMCKRYPRIYGHCSYGPRPIALLKSLGARFVDDPDGRPAYVIGG